MQNLKQLLDRFLTNRYKVVKPLLAVNDGNDKTLPDLYLQNLQAIPTESLDATYLFSSLRDSSKHEREVSNSSRKRRLETYQQVKQLQANGWKIEQISRRLNINHTTIRKFFYADNFPERTRRTPKSSMINSYLIYLESRFGEGCRNGMQLWREIKEKGYPGTWRQVLRWLRNRRQQDQLVVQGKAEGKTDNAGVLLTPPPDTSKTPSPRELAWLMMRQPEQLKQQEQKVLSCIRQDEQVNQLYQMAQQLGEIIRKGEASRLDQWLEECKAFPISMLQTFAARIKQDYNAVQNALESKWSNGQTEGQINRLKLLKRQMYGRAKFDLLRRRVLYAA